MSGLTLPKNAFLRTFDYVTPGQSAVVQNMALYGLVIASRIGAAAWRGQQIDSYNEVREHVVRDSFGFVFWFFAMERLKRLLLRLSASDLRRDLLHLPPGTATHEAAPVGTGWPSRLRREFDMVFRSAIPDAAQLQERQTQLLSRLQQTADDLGLSVAERDQAMGAVRSRFARLTRTMNLASFFGMVGAIALLGLAIPMLNIVMTRNNVKKRGLGSPTPVRPAYSPSPASFMGGASSGPYPVAWSAGGPWGPTG